MAGKSKKGLRVKFCENVAKYTDSRTGIARLVAAIPDGWFIQIWHCGKWRSLMDLRFVRERDALRAAVALTAAGLDSYPAMARVDGLRVKQIACEALEW